MTSGFHRATPGVLPHNFSAIALAGFLCAPTPGQSSLVITYGSGCNGALVTTGARAGPATPALAQSRPNARYALVV